MKGKSHVETPATTGLWSFCWSSSYWSPTSYLSTCSSPHSGILFLFIHPSGVCSHQMIHPSMYFSSPCVCLCSYTFSKVQERSDTYWKFQRYNLIVEYHSRPNLAPPFIILSHINLFIKRNFCKVPSTKIHHFGKL